jgi:hypothetical protein
MSLHLHPAKQAPENSPMFEGYGLQAVHNRGVKNPALAAEGCYSPLSHKQRHPCRSFDPAVPSNSPQNRNRNELSKLLIGFGSSRKPN